MTFEHALEAMKQGKKAGRKAWADWDKSKMIFLKGNYFYWVGEEDIGVALTLDFLEADDWEIYEEPQKEPETAAEKVRQILEDVFSDIDFADEPTRNAWKQLIGTAETSGKLEPKNTVSSEELQALKNSLRNLPVTISGHLHTGKNSNLQEEMKQALSRKFFELEKYSDDESTVNSMLNIYNSIFSD